MVDQPNSRMIMRGGMMLPEDVVRSNTPMIPTRKQENQVISKTTGVQPLTQRMSAAFDRMKSKEGEGNKITSKDAVILGKLFLEIEQVKNNLNSITTEFRNTNRKKTELDAKENELLEEETDRLTALGAGFKRFRRTLGGIAAALSGKQFLEGDVQGGVQNAGIALTAFLPDIIKVVSTVVLGKMLLSGRGMSAARGVSTGGGRGGLLPMLLAGGGLLAAGTALGSRGGVDQRRLELTKQQSLPQLLSRNDVKRFRSLSSRFDDILSDFGSQNEIAFNVKPPQKIAGITSAINMPKGFGEQAGEIGSKLVNFFSDDRAEEIEKIGKEIDGKEVSDDIAAANLLVIPTLEEMVSDVTIVNDETNLASNDAGGNTVVVEGNNQQVSNNQKDLPKSSNIFVKSTFSDNSKISYILEYGGASVVG
tara:strand:- start:656 stop:1918 length:1263 start_codon:yes stop_codon:yes gene_type:complete